MRKYFIHAVIFFCAAAALVCVLKQGRGLDLTLTIPSDGMVLEVDLCSINRKISFCTYNSFTKEIKTETCQWTGYGECSTLGIFSGECACWVNGCNVLATSYWSDPEGQIVTKAVRTDGSERFRYAGAFPGPPPVHMKPLFDSGELVGVSGLQSDWEHPPLSPIIISQNRDPQILLMRESDVFSFDSYTTEGHAIVAFSFRGGESLEIGIVHKQDGECVYTRSIVSDVSEPCGISFTDRGKRLVALSKSRLIVLDAATGSRLGQVEVSTPIARSDQLRHAVSSSFDGSVFAYLDGAGVYLTDSSLSKRYEVSPGIGQCLDISTNGETLAVGFTSPDRIEVHDLSDLLAVGWPAGPNNSAHDP